MRTTDRRITRHGQWLQSYWRHKDKDDQRMLCLQITHSIQQWAFSIQPAKHKSIVVAVSGKIFHIWRESCRRRDSESEGRAYPICLKLGAGSVEFSCPHFDLSQCLTDTHYLAHSEGET